MGTLGPLKGPRFGQSPHKLNIIPEPRPHMLKMFQENQVNYSRKKRELFHENKENYSRIIG